jgi:Cell division protein FtsI/penicillin-binding protein 2
MTAQIANGGYKIKPRIIHNDKEVETIIAAWNDHFTSKDEEKNLLAQAMPNYSKYTLEPLYRNQENIKFLLDALYGATNEPMGTSYRSRHIKSKYIYAGKTGTSQIRKITEEERRLKLKNVDLPYEKRDHALFTAFAPFKHPRYAFSIVVEHGGAGSTGAAPLIKKLVKQVIDRHKERNNFQQKLFQEV